MFSGNILMTLKAEKEDPKNTPKRDSHDMVAEGADAATTTSLQRNARHCNSVTIDAAHVQQATPRAYIGLLLWSPILSPR